MKKKTNVNASQRTIGQEGAVAHPAPGLGVNGDGTIPAHRTNSLQAVISDVLVRCQITRKQGSLDGEYRTPTCNAHSLAHARNTHASR